MVPIKRQAQIISKETGVQHSAALEVAAKVNGYKNWHEVTTHPSAEANPNTELRTVLTELESYENEEDPIPSSSIEILYENLRTWLRPYERVSIERYNLALLGRKGRGFTITAPPSFVLRIDENSEDGIMVVSSLVDYRARQLRWEGKAWFWYDVDRKKKPFNQEVFEDYLLVLLTKAKEIEKRDSLE